MPTLTINGKDFPVGDNFMSMTPEQQGAYVDDLVKQGSAPAVTPAPSGPDPMPGSAAPAAAAPPRLSARDALNFPPPGSTNDMGQLLTTLGVRAGGSLLDFDPLSPVRRLISPTLERAEQTGKGAGQAAGDAFFKATGIPEYQPPDTGLGRTGMAALQGGTTGAAFGPAGAVLGALSGGAGQGATELLQGVLSPDNVERVSTVASLAPGLYSAKNAPRGPIPSTKELADTAGRQFDQFRQSPLRVDPNAIVGLGHDMSDNLANNLGIRPAHAPETYGIIKDMVNPATGAMHTDPAALHSMIKQLNTTINKALGDRSTYEEARAAGVAKKMVEDFIGTLDQNQQHLVAGTPGEVRQAVDTFNDARGNYAAAMRTNSITGELDRATTGIAERASGRAAASNSGSNFDNLARQQAERILERPRDVSRLSDDEIAALKHVRDGTWYGSNMVRRLANVAGGGGGLGQLIGSVGAGGAALASGAQGIWPYVIGGAVPAAGMSLKGAENALANRRLSQAADVMRQNSPLAQSQLTPRDIAVLRALMPGLLAPPPNTGGNYGGDGFLAP